MVCGQTPKGPGTVPSTQQSLNGEDLSRFPSRSIGHLDTAEDMKASSASGTWGHFLGQKQLFWVLRGYRVFYLVATLRTPPPGKPTLWGGM